MDYQRVRGVDRNCERQGRADRAGSLVIHISTSFLRLISEGQLAGIFL